jgi:hypothetical protein
LSTIGPPGYPSFSTAATLSNASPTASSIVEPISTAEKGSSMRNSVVCPPETTSDTNGACGRDGDCIHDA